MFINISIYNLSYLIPFQDLQTGDHIHETTPSSAVHATDHIHTPSEHVHGTTPASVLRAAERIITPIQPPVQPGTPVQQQPTGGFTSTPNSANPTFAVLKATALQQALGHPMAYARVLMQVKYEILSCRFVFLL